MRLFSTIFLLTLLSIAKIANGFTIKGRLTGLPSCWYPKIYLEAIHDIDGVYSSASQNLLLSAPVDSLGNFILTGNELPDDVRLYRLYVTPSANISSQISTGIKRNYILLFLNNHSEVFVSSNHFCAPYFDYQTSGSADNKAMSEIQTTINKFDKHYAEATSETQKKFLENRICKDLLCYADSTSTPYAALFALLETDINTNHQLYGSVYRKFAAYFSQKAPNSPYGKQLTDKLLTLDLQNQIIHGKTSTPWYVWLLSVMLALSVLINIFLFRKLRSSEPPSSIPIVKNNPEQLIAALTIKEREILLMVDKGLSNKEIAEQLNVELSTVKTHVSRIYQKLSINNRKEVREIARHL